MKKIKEFVKKIFSKKIYIAITVVLILSIILGITFVAEKIQGEKLDTTYIVGRLQKSSELITAKINYTGFSRYEDDGIKIINKTSFLVTYEAVASTGIDVEEINVTSNDITKEVIVTIPKAKIFDVKIKPDSIKYYDEKFSIFNIDKKEEANKAQAEAEKTAKEEILKMGVLEMADNQAQALITGLIEDLIPEEYELIFNTKE